MSRDLERVFLERLVAGEKITRDQAKEVYAEIKRGRASGERPSAAEVTVGAGFADLQTAIETLRGQGRTVYSCPECGTRWLVSTSADSTSQTRIKAVCDACEATLGPFRGSDLAGLRIVFDRQQEKGLDDPLIGQVIQGCRIEEKLGQGGRGVVYLGTDMRLKRKVAVKFLQEELAGRDKSYVHKFVEEARAAARLEHPNIVSIYAVGKKENYYFIIMQYVQGGAVADRLGRLGKLWVDEAVNIVQKIADGLAYAHRNGIVHLDVKPDNIMLDRESIPRLADFGLAMRVRADEAGVPTQLAGTPKYMSPEQARAEEVDARSDIYSLGITLYRMLCGKTPYAGSVTEVLAAHKDKKPIPPLPRGEEYSANLRAVVAKMVEKNKRKRYEKMEDVIAELERVKSGEETDALRERPRGKAADQFEDEYLYEGDVRHAKSAFEGEEAPKRTNVLPVMAICVGVVVALVAVWALVSTASAKKKAEGQLEAALAHARENPLDVDEIKKLLGTIDKDLLADDGRARFDEAEADAARRAPAVRKIARYEAAARSLDLDELRGGIREMEGLAPACAELDVLEKRRGELEALLRDRVGLVLSKRMDDAARLADEGQLDEAIRLYEDVVRSGREELVVAAREEITKVEGRRALARLRGPYLALVEAVEKKRYYKAAAAARDVAANRDKLVETLSDEERTGLPQLEKAAAANAGRVSVGIADLGDYAGAAEALGWLAKMPEGVFELVFLGGAEHEIRGHLHNARGRVSAMTGEGDARVGLKFFQAEAPGLIAADYGVRLSGGKMRLSNLELAPGDLFQAGVIKTCILLSSGDLRLENCVVDSFEKSVRIVPTEERACSLDAFNCIMKEFDRAVELATQAGTLACSVKLDHCILSGRPQANNEGIFSTFGVHGDEHTTWTVRVSNCILENTRRAFDERYMGEEVFARGQNTTWETDFNCFYDKECIYALSLAHSPEAAEVACENVKEWRRRYRQGRSSIEADPRFVDRMTFELAPNSPCRGRGEGGGDIGLAP